jgi:hypothetical protein
MWPLGPGFALGLAYPINHPFLLTLMAAALMIPVLYVAGLGAFWLFYKSVDFFDNI